MGSEGWADAVMAVWRQVDYRGSPVFGFDPSCVPTWVLAQQPAVKLGRGGKGRSP